LPTEVDASGLAVTAKPSILTRVFKAFSYSDFRLMWFGACISSIGTWMQIVAQSWLIYRLSHSAFLLALDQFLGGIPIFLFSLLGGVVADRVERRKILLASQYVQLASSGLLAILVATGAVQIWHILCLSFVSGLAQAFGGPAYQALIPTLVNREDMPNAIALNAASFLAPIIALLLISSRFLPKTAKESVFASLKLGIKFVRRQESMAALIVLAFCMTALSMPLRTYIPVFVNDIFRAGPRTYGDLLSLMGVGSICGSLAIASLGNASGKGRRALVMLLCLGATISAFAISRSLAFSSAILVLFGFSLMAVFASVSSLVQLITTDEMRGRVMSVYNCAFRGGMPLGNLISGWMVPVFTAPVVLTANGLLLIAVALYFLLVHRRVTAL